ncbi:Uncharacterized protein dnm_083920 [Desulfonema magnum]|uniref:Uncharacterized protein n=1 Tax=Desulfonema magnum TaxID=45655 RepID=A0A975BV49_9BACT|nr:Uncharacterized protein dnm_083920 [Desulfonema magnum]
MKLRCEFNRTLIRTPFSAVPPGFEKNCSPKKQFFFNRRLADKNTG